MKEKAQNLFDSLKDIKDIENLIHEGEAENQYIECKCPLSPSSFTRDFKYEIARIISGISNGGGGMILFGISTDNKDGLDILTQIQPIAYIDQFIKKIQQNIPLLVFPQVSTEIKILKKKKNDTKGISILYISGIKGDPVRAEHNKVFYLRVGDLTVEMPYETIRRMFIGGVSPDLDVYFDSHIIKRQENGKWKIPISIGNLTSIPAKSVTVSVTINNYSVCEEIIAKSPLRDVSHINPGRKIFMSELDRPLHRGLNIIVGDFLVLLKKNKKMLDVSISLYADHMRAKNLFFKIYLSKNKHRIIKTKEDFLY